MAYKSAMVRVSLLHVVIQNVNRDRAADAQPTSRECRKSRRASLGLHKTTIRGHTARLSSAELIEQQRRRVHSPHDLVGAQRQQRRPRQHGLDAAQRRADGRSSPGRCICGARRFTGACRAGCRRGRSKSGDEGKYCSQQPLGLRSQHNKHLGLLHDAHNLQKWAGYAAIGIARPAGHEVWSSRHHAQATEALNLLSTANL